MVRASSGETHWTGERTPGLRGDAGSGDWFSYCPSLAARLRRGAGGSAGCFSRACTPGRNGRTQRALSVMWGKDPSGLIPPEKAVHLSPGGPAGAGLVSPQYILPPASLCPHPGFSAGWGIGLDWLAFTTHLHSAQGWGSEHKGLIQETDVNFFQAPEAEGQSFQAKEGRWREENQSPRRLHQPTSNTRPVGKTFGKNE